MVLEIVLEMWAQITVVVGIKRRPRAQRARPLGLNHHIACIFGGALGVVCVP